MEEKKIKNCIEYIVMKIEITIIYFGFKWPVVCRARDRFLGGVC